MMDGWVPPLLPLQLVAVIVRHAVAPPHGVRFRLCAFLVPVLEHVQSAGEKAPGQNVNKRPVVQSVQLYLLVPGIYLVLQYKK